ncbi:MAG: thiamine phosphate synthase [Nitrospirales bacterium]|nr:thiamine phosphate synthase [Nitrospirales bacterium]
MDFNLYLITDRKLFAETDSMLRAVEKALLAGVRAVQLREKDLPIRDLLALAYRMRELTQRYNALLFINDRVDIALICGADGVHLGRAGMPASAVKRIAKDLLIGVSTHSLEEAMEAEREGADFITFGPLYATPSKLPFGEPVGVEALRGVRGKISIPIFGLGGIKPHHIKDVMESGSQGIALISGILAAEDIRSATENYIHEIGEAV